MLVMIELLIRRRFVMAGVIYLCVEVIFVLCFGTDCSIADEMFSFNRFRKLSISCIERFLSGGILKLALESVSSNLENFGQFALWKFFLFSPSEASKSSKGNKSRDKVKYSALWSLS